MNTEDLSYALVQRLRLIDIVLEHSNVFNRKILMDYFGISMPQASTDLANYIKLTPGNLIYDKSNKTYRRAPTFQRVWK